MSALDSRISWIRLALSLAISLIGNVGMWAIIVIMPAIEAEFGVDRASAALPYTLTMAGFALGNWVIGAWVDRWGVAPVMAGSAVLIALSFGVATLAPSILILSAIQFVVGFATAASFGPLIADVSQWFLRRRGIAVGIIASGNYLSGAIWPLLLADILAGAGWRMAYLVIAGAALLVMLPLTRALRQPVPEAAMQASASAAAARAQTTGLPQGTLLWLLAVAGVCCCVAMSMPQVHIVAYCVDLGYGPAVGAEMLSLMLLGGVVSRLVSGLLADRLGGVMTLLIGSSLQMLALFLYLPTSGLTPLYIVSLVFGLSQGGIVPSYAVIVREYLPPKEAGAKVGLVIMATIVGMALGGWVSGWIYDMTGSYRLAFINGIAFNAVNVGVMALILIRSRPRAPGRAVPA
jgi:MFS family permease